MARVRSADGPWFRASLKPRVPSSTLLPFLIFIGGVSLLTPNIREKRVPLLLFVFFFFLLLLLLVLLVLLLLLFRGYWSLEAFQGCVSASVG